MVKYTARRIIGQPFSRRLLGVADLRDMGLVVTKEAAKRLGVSVRRAQAMITQGIIPAKKLGRDWMIEESDLEKILATERKTGRPPKR